MKLIDGKVISAHIKQQVKGQVDELKAQVESDIALAKAMVENIK